jgi:hypothetical protein
MTDTTYTLEVNSNFHPAMNAVAAKLIAVDHALTVLGYDEAEIVTETVNHSLGNDSVEVLIRVATTSGNRFADEAAVEYWSYNVQGDTVEWIDNAELFFTHNGNVNDEMIELHSRVVLNG